MISNENKKKYLILSLIITISVAIISCDFDNAENESYIYNNNAKTERVKTNIEEAKVLSEISILNETIILLSQLSLEKSNVYTVKAISNRLKKESIEIKKHLNDLAKNDDTGFPKAYLIKVKELLESEIIQLEYLSAMTNDIDFKVLAVKISVKLKYNLNQVNKTIK